MVFCFLDKSQGLQVDKRAHLFWYKAALPIKFMFGKLVLYYFIVFCINSLTMVIHILKKTYCYNIKFLISELYFTKLIGNIQKTFKP